MKQFKEYIIESASLFDYAWCNYSREVDKNFRFDEFGDKFADEGYSRANH